MPEHGGDISRLAQRAGCARDDILDLSANINPLGPPPWLRAVVNRRLEEIAHYPPPDAAAFLAAAAKAFGVPADGMVAGNGSTELLYALLRALAPARAVIPSPAYADYTHAAELAGAAPLHLRLSPATNFSPDMDLLAEVVRPGDVVLLGRPANPAGTVPALAAVNTLAAGRPDAVVVVDEAFGDFLRHEDTMLSRCPPNVVVLRSLTKFYAIPGLRLGFAATAAGLRAKLRRELPPWSVNSLAQHVGIRALQDQAYAAETRRCVAQYRAFLEAELARFPLLRVFPSAANYLLIRRQDRGQAADLAERLLQEHHIAVRVCDDYVGLDGSYFRVAVRSPAETRRFVTALEQVLDMPGPRATKAPRRRTPALMIQGTTSNAGKSVLAAAFCRILTQDGVRVAPFKAQNMSLNSFVTPNGGEMGRAQVVQAQACRLDPDVRMNPILLKPNSDTGSQVICMGKPIGNMDVMTYTERKAKLREAVHATYDSLAADYEAIVLEGAGSPAEVNLKRHDLVNMQMARYAAAPVVLVGDIDRGGLYAAFIGTLAVMEEWERRLISGFLVNRFRGDASLLQEAHDYVVEYTGKPVLGVVPYLHDLGLPEEDSVEFKSGSGDSPASRSDAVDIACIDLPHISNFTDLDALRLEPDVQLRIVRRPQDLGRPDAVILPGSKNVRGDLAALSASGMSARLVQLAQDAHTVLVGLCGGFQMLGTGIADPHRLEARHASYTPGLGALPVETELAPTKKLTRSAGRHPASGAAVVGYEIHHGVTEVGACAPMFLDSEGRQLGVCSADGRIWGTYLHGVFDLDPFRRVFIDDLRVRKGLRPLGRVQARYGIEAGLDALADVVRQAVDMRDIYTIMGL